MSDDEDAAELRRMRAGKGPALDGPLGNQLAELRRRQAAASADDSFFEDSHGPTVADATPQQSKHSSSLAQSNDNVRVVRDGCHDPAPDESDARLPC